MARHAAARLMTAIVLFVSVLLLATWQLGQSEAVTTVYQTVRQTWPIADVEPSPILPVSQPYSNVPEVLTSLIDETNTKTPNAHSGNWSFDIDRHLLKLQRRAPPPDFDIGAGEALYSEYDTKGQWLWCVLKDPSAAGQKVHSTWDKFEQIQGWGWHDRNDDDDRDILHYEREGITDLVKGSVGKEYEWNHSEETDTSKLPSWAIQKGSTYPPTDATYDNFFWPDKGVIVANLNEGPQYKINQHATPKDFDGEDWGGTDKPPGLAQWSDVVWLTWVKATTDDQRPFLKVILRRMITNTETKNMIAYILSKWYKEDPKAATGRAPSYDNKVTIKPGNPGFNALLYTPNMRGVMWLLIQHSDILNDKYKIISSIDIYEESGTEGSGNMDYAPDLLVNLGPIDGTKESK